MELNCPVFLKTYNLLTLPANYISHAPDCSYYTGFAGGIPQLFPYSFDIHCQGVFIEETTVAIGNRVQNCLPWHCFTFVNYQQKQYPVLQH